MVQVELLVSTVQPVLRAALQASELPADPGGSKLRPRAVLSSGWLWQLLGFAMHVQGVVPLQGSPFS